jgi:hypothetical protein
MEVVDLKNRCRHCGKDLTEDNKCGWPKEKKKPRGYSPCWDDDVYETSSPETGAKLTAAT